MRRVTLALLALTLAGPAHADWSVKRAPDDSRAVDALFGALLRAPDDRGALQRLVAHAGGKAGLAKLAARCDAKAQGAALLACGQLHREAGNAEVALTRFTALNDDVRAQRAMGELLLTLGRADEAVAQLEKARAGLPPAEAQRVLEPLLTAYERSRAPQDQRRRAIEEIGKGLLAARPHDAAIVRRVTDALASVGGEALAAQLLAPSIASADPSRRVALLLRQAQLLEAAHQEGDALAALERALASLPARDSRRAEVQERIVGIERGRDKLAELAERWKSLPEGRRDAASEELLGRVLDELGDTTEALRHLQRASKLEPRAIGPRRLMIRLHARAGDEDAAIAELRKLVQVSGDDPRPALELAERLFVRPGGTGAIEARALARSLGQRHRDATTHAALAALYEKWGHKDAALAETQLLVRLEPSEVEHLIALGELYDQRGEKPQAMQAWGRIATANAPLPARLRLAEVLAEHDHAAEALAILERALHEHPGDLQIERKLADVLDRLRRDEEAEAIYRRLLNAAVTRDDATAVRDAGSRWLELATRRNVLASGLTQLTPLAEAAKNAAAVELVFVVASGREREKNSSEAERLLRKLTKTAAKPADKARALEALAELIAPRYGSRNHESLSLLVQAAEADATRAPLLYGKAASRAAALYRDDEALRYAEKAVSLAPLDPNAHERLGSFVEARDPTRALAAYDRALELDGGRDRLRLRAAELALRRGEDDDAASRYRTLLLRAHDEQTLDEAAHRAVVVHELTGRLGVLEREIAPRATTAEGRAVLRRVLVDVERRYVPLLATRVSAGDADALKELQRVSHHALGPLLDGVVDGDRDERTAAVQLLGQLGAESAAPLLLRLAAGEAARRGGSAPSIELRSLAANSAVGLVTERDVPQLTRLAQDPEQRLRLAAAVGLARLQQKNEQAPAIAAALSALVRDGHDLVRTAACLALANVPPAYAWPHWPTLLTAVASAEKPLSQRACAVALARRFELGLEPAADKLLQALQAKLEGAPPPQVPGYWRVLLATEPAGSLRVNGALLSLLRDEAIPRPGIAAEPNVTDVAGWLASRETLRAAGPAPERRARRGDVVRGVLVNELVRGLTTIRPAASLEAPVDAVDRILADLLSSDPLLPVLAADPGQSLEASRAALLDQLLAGLQRVVDDPTAGRHAPALLLCAERPDGLRVIASVLGSPKSASDRVAALHALGTSRPVPVSMLERLKPLVQKSLQGSWRERREALAAWRLHPELALSTQSLDTLLARDRDPLVRLATPPASRDSSDNRERVTNGDGGHR